MSIDIVIRRERPDQPDVIELIEALDAYLATLYAPEANHHTRRGLFGGYPDNGLSVFYEKRL